MPWDVFIAARLEVIRGLTTEQVRAALAAGGLTEDDLIRPAGSNDPWTRLADHPVRLDAAPELLPEEPPAPPVEEESHPATPPDLGRLDLDLDRDRESVLALPATPPTDELETPPIAPSPRSESADAAEDDDDIAAFTLSRGGPEKIEELDLAAMVDVAFQLVLFFLVTATTVLYKTLQIPTPRPETPPAAAAQGVAAPKQIEDLQDAYIIVVIDPQGRATIDKEPVPATFEALVARLRRARADTGRTAMLLSADPATLHRQAVLAYDAANEIGLRIAIARPAKPADPS